MTFAAVDVTDGRSVKTPQSPGELNQALWEGWWLVTSPPAPRGPSEDQLRTVEVQLSWLLTDTTLQASFADWYAAQIQGGVVVGPPLGPTTTVVDQGAYVTLAAATAVDNGSYVTVTANTAVAIVDHGSYATLQI